MAIYSYTLPRGRRVSPRGITNETERREQDRTGGQLTLDGRGKTRSGDLRTDRKRDPKRGYYA